jgi:hypothetical protein
VYQATDTKLGRSVAIKFLPEAFRHDPRLQTVAWEGIAAIFLSYIWRFW